MRRHRASRALLAAAVSMAVLSAAEPRPMRPFEATSFDGRRVSSESLKGSKVVLMFLATDCPHCQETARRLDPVYRDLRREGLEIVGLTLNRIDNRGIREFATRFGASFPIAISSRDEFSRVTGISVMTRIYYPYVLFVDRQGVIREEHQGFEQPWFENLEANFRSAVAALE